MADEAQYEGLDEATLTEMMANASSYDERSNIRKAIRKVKGSGNKSKKTGSASYRRAGYQAPKSMAIPNSVTGNVLPNRVNLANIHKTEVPQGSSTTVSYLKARTVLPSLGAVAGSSGKGSSSRGSTTSPRGSTSSITPEPKLSEAPREEASEVCSSSVTEGRTPSPQPPAPRMTVDEPPREPSPEPRDPTPEPPKEPSPEPEPPREPTPEPEPPREPTPEPEPPKEPTPEPEPPREPTPEPEPPKEPTPEPEPPKEPTPEPREPTPEPEPSKPIREPTPEPLEEVDHAEVEEEEEEEDGEEDDEDEDDEDEVGGRVLSPSYGKGDERVEYRQTKKVGDGPKSTSGLPSDVLAKREEGIEGDFRKKLQKTAETKIDTRAAFPQARPKGEQVDFRDVLKKTRGPEKKKFKTGGHAQLDFRGNLKKAPEKAPKPSRRAGDSDEVEDDQEEEEEPEEEQTEPADEEEQQQQHDDQQQQQDEEDQEPEDQPEEPEEEEATKEEEEEVEKEEVEKEEEEEAPEETDSKPSSSAQDDESFEARQAERKRRREQRQKELEEMSTSPKPVENGTKDEKDESREKKEGSPSDPDSYEARREARRKAREERIKAASARVDEKPRLTYRERKALEAKKNAKQNREKWENREEESGAKDEAKPPSFKKKDTATQQLLHWCQHKTKYYENVNIKDFRQSWSDGLAFCAVLHSFLPDKIPYDDLTPENPRKNFTIAFEAAVDAGIPQMLDVDDMVAVKIPDAKSIMTFLVTIYQHFNS